MCDLYSDLKIIIRSIPFWARKGCPSGMALTLPICILNLSVIVAKKLHISTVVQTKIIKRAEETNLKNKKNERERERVGGIQGPKK